jgi:hypothetical protein
MLVSQLWVAMHPYTGKALPALGLLLAAFLLPVGILITRDNVKARRQEIIKELEKFFTHDRDGGQGRPRDLRQSIIPSFEFVKTKYYLSNGDGEIPIRWYSTPIIIFAGLSGICFLISTVLVVAPDSDEFAVANLVPKSLFLVGGDIPSEQNENFMMALSVAMFAFFGAYVSAIKSLIRSVSNFDLSPLTFFRASYGIIAATVISVVLWRAMPLTLSESVAALNTSQGSGGLVSVRPLWFAAAFIIGFVPGLAERHLLAAWRRGRVKQMDARATDRTKTIPLELIDGIDADIRARLEDFNLFDVQNLATANPIMLFVETPYGIYQSIDWVAQAQLATAVGVERFLKLRDLSIRNVFDLERTFFMQRQCSSNGLRYRIAEILLPSDASTSHRPGQNGLAEEAQALVCMIIDDLAVLRLRQIWNTVEKNLAEFSHLRGCGICMEGRALAPPTRQTPADMPPS